MIRGVFVRRLTVSQNEITEGSILRSLLAFFFPILLGTFFQQLYNTADAVIVGNYVGKQALAAVGGTTSNLIGFLVNLFVGLSSGTTVVVAQYYGARKYEDVSRSVHTAIALSIAAAVIITVLGIAVSYPALKAMGTPDDVMDYALTYLRIYFLGSIASFLYNMGSGILRAMGDSKRPLYFLIVACLTNIVLDFVFVVWFRWGVTGVAVGTVLSQVLSAVLILQALIKNDICPFSFRRMRFYGDVLKSIIRIGLPAGIQSDMYAISNIMIQASINSFGTNTVAAWAAFGKMDSFYWMVSSAFGIAITTFVGQNFGAQKYERVHKGTKLCLALAFGAAFFFSIVFCLLRFPLLSLFTNDGDVLQIGAGVVLQMVPFYFLFVCIEILSGSIRGTGDSLIPMLLTCGGVCVLRVVWIFAVFPLHRTLGNIVLSYPVTWVITSVLFVIYYLKGGWMKRRRGETEHSVS